MTELLTELRAAIRQFVATHAEDLGICGWNLSAHRYEQLLGDEEAMHAVSSPNVGADGVREALEGALSEEERELLNVRPSNPVTPGEIGEAIAEAPVRTMLDESQLLHPRLDLTRAVPAERAMDGEPRPLSTDRGEHPASERQTPPLAQHRSRLDPFDRLEHADGFDGEWLTKVLENSEAEKIVRSELYRWQRENCGWDHQRQLADSYLLASTAKGRTEDGVVGELEQDVWIEVCSWRGNPLPMVRIGSKVEFSSPVYFQMGYTFHPDSRPEEPDPSRARGLTLPAASSTTGRIFVVDTGALSSESPALSLQTHVQPIDIDSFPKTVNAPDGSTQVDLARGHGPAIVELIESISTARSVHLRQVHYFKGIASVAGQPVALLFEAPDNSGDLVRGLDQAALVHTLQHLTDSYGIPDLNDNDVVNLSLGTVACPGAMKDDPVGDWIRTNGNGATFVVAAGNHGPGNDAPSWPAAYCNPSRYRAGFARTQELATLLPIDEVVSVGSRAPGSSIPHHFSASDGPTPHQSWISHWEDGHEVPVLHPDPIWASTKSAPTTTNAEWTGTSFAAPIVAANL